MTENATPQKSVGRPKTRFGMRFMGLHVPEQLTQQVKILAAEHQTTIQALMIEFMREGLKKYGKNIE